MKKKPFDVAWVSDLSLRELDVLLRAVVDARVKKLDERQQEAFKLLQVQSALLRLHDESPPLVRKSTN
ncbi:hypothetical protein [Bradyrhizobium sp. AUGA SZCCT0283]|uniref:hypothetical protein n=1 Tax=Bradyrhizobium sp. AUGA SZCCT0283 TaxID=2807671 RepID=UPI001BA9AAF6|nr:hypothetical protein [Bradyrhizobium sp. AUGA SZCCT0283]MBR1274257.1 hypothetical protein [Bradyrhizobium sp. AUGA SZCCT0283]